MKARNEILEELGALSPVVRDISRATPYGVPAGYFDGFPALVMDRLSAEGMVLAEPEPSFGFDKPLAFSVPEGYFEGFAQGLLDKIKMAATTGAESVDAELSRLSPILSGMSRQTPYQVPAGYFEELSPVEPILAELRDKPTYTVPEGYFAGVAAEVRERLGLTAIGSKKEPAKVVSMGGGVRRLSIWKYSAAAVVAGLVLTIGWLRLHNNSSTKGQPVAIDNTNIAGSLNKVSDQDLQGYMDDDQNDETGHIAAIAEPMNNTATLDINDSDVKSLLGDVPDGELKQYMEEHGGASDIATN